MSNEKFEAERDVREVTANVRVIKPGQTGTLSSVLTKEIRNIVNPNYLPLKIPRRPEWTNEMSGQEIR